MIKVYITPKVKVCSEGASCVLHVCFMNVSSCKRGINLHSPNFGHRYLTLRCVWDSLCWRFRPIVAYIGLSKDFDRHGQRV